LRSNSIKNAFLDVELTPRKPGPIFPGQIIPESPTLSVVGAFASIEIKPLDSPVLSIMGTVGFVE
jgi:hypothetical protein